MGLHDTPAGQFYVQHSLRTGEVLQILPVKRQDRPAALPSVDALGITETFIERRRVTLAADQARVSTPQDRLQQELARAGGERLLETGKAVLAGAAAASASASASAATAATESSASSSGSTASCAARDTPVCWPESVDSRQVLLPSFREMDAALLCVDGSRLPELQGLQHQQHQQHQQQHLALPSDRKRPATTSAAEPHGRRLRSCSHRSSLERRDYGHNGHNGHVDHDHDHDHGLPYAAPPASRFPPATSQATSPSSAASSPPMLSYSSSSSPSSSSSSSSSPSSPVRLAPGPAPPPLPKKNKTVWIIRTLEPRRGGPGGANGCGDGDDDGTAYAPQRVQTHVETHVM